MNLAHAPTLYLLCGKIAAGKSTLARRLAARPATLLISKITGPRTCSSMT
jgi:predicted kinase